MTNPADALDRSDSTTARPTIVRHLVVGISVLMAVSLYLDRFCVSFAERYIKEDLGLSDSQMAWFLSLFFLSYSLAQVPSGWLSDRFGARSMLVLYILTWSLFTGLIGMSTGFAMLIAMRLGTGLCQAGAFPTSAALVSRWVPLTRRGVASAWVALGGRIGGAVAPVLTALLMVMFVPLDVSPLIDSTTLLDGAKLCQRLAKPLRVSSADFAATSDAERIDAHVAALVPVDDRAAILAAADASSSTSAPLSAEQVAEILPGINALLRLPNMYSEPVFGRLKLPKEAMDYLARQKDAPSESGQASANAEQHLLRFNRLLLEAAYPAEIGKLYVKGWRQVLVVYGLAGLLIALGVWVIFRNKPSEHPWCNQAELNLIDAGRPVLAANVEPAPTKLPVREVLLSRSLWLCSLSQFGTNIAWLFLVTWLPRYLLEMHQVPILQRGLMSSLPLFGGMVGLYCGGSLTDWLAKRVGVRWGRVIPMAFTRFFAAAAYVSCLWIDSPWPAVIAFILVSFFCDLGIAAVWAFTQDVGGRSVGAILGWGNMWGNFGAFVAPHCYNYVLGPQPGPREWNMMFLSCAGMFLVSGFASLGVDASIPVAPEERPVTVVG